MLEALPASTIGASSTALDRPSTDHAVDTAESSDPSGPYLGLPRVSVIIPAYNRRDYIAATLTSVLRQTMREFEAIVVDDGSTDGTIDVVEEFCRRDPRLHCVRQNNAGCGAARNHGLAESSPLTEYVIFLDSDDVWAPTALETLVGAADAAPQRSIFYSPWESISCIDGEGSPIPPVIPKSITAPILFSRVLRRKVTAQMCDDDPLPYMSTICLFLSPGAVLVRKSILDQAPFDTSLANNEDWDLWIRLARKHKFCAVPGSIFFYRKHASAKSNNWKRVARNRAQIYRKLQLEPGLPERERRLYRSAAWRHSICQASICAALFVDAAREGDFRTALVYSARIARRYLSALSAWAQSSVRLK